jgi:glucosamine-6-phosphate deaminase
MRVIIEKDSESASKRASEFMIQFIQQKPNCVLGLATGSTPLQIYAEFIAHYQAGDIDFSQVVSFNLDEYVGLGPADPHSYRSFMQEHLFSKINILPENTHVPDGRSLDFDNDCRQYEKKIQDHGGIDFQLLGIGRDGHIAFNEPGSSLGSRTRLKTLTGETIKDNARFFGGIENVPRLAITMGVGTILETRKCILVAFGEHKAQAVSQAIEGPVTAQVTASALQFHPDVIVVVDEAAAKYLKRKSYYEEIEQSHRSLEEPKL